MGDKERFLDDLAGMLRLAKWTGGAGYTKQALRTMTAFARQGSQKTSC
jgi:hypothetical protein